jgi:HAE1 family hydrophobic/amphiphilic exporter-1
MSLAGFSVRRRVTTTMVILIVVLFGIVSVRGLGLDLMPELEFPICAIITRYPGVAAEEIEQYITKPLEGAVLSVKGIKSVYSTSQEGLSNIVVEFEWGTNLDFAAQDIRDSMSFVEAFLPPEAENPFVVKFDVGQMPVIFYGVSGDVDTMKLRKLLEDDVAPIVERIEGVASVMVLGGKEREINVLVSKDKLDAYNIPLLQIAGTLGAENLNISAGHVETSHKEYLIRTIGQFQSIEDIRNTVLTVRNGAAIRVRDIADVVDTHKEMRGGVYVDNKPALLVFITKQSGANTVTVSDAISKKTDELRMNLPGNMRFSPIFDQGEIITMAVEQTAYNGLTGAFLAIMLVFFFLRNWRPTLAIFLAIPLSVLATFIAMNLADYTFNMFTLGGLALGVGMLVDNAVVVIENIFRHLQTGADRATAARKGAEEVTAAITASTLTTMAVFVPMVIVSGLAGKLARPVALTVCMSLLASLFVATTLVPMIAATIFRAKDSRKRTGGPGGSGRFREAYKVVLRGVLRRRVFVLLGVGAAFVLACAGAYILVQSGEFMPEEDIPIAMMRIELPVGTKLSETEAVVSDIVGKVAAMKDDVESATSIVGPGDVTQFEAARGVGIADVNQAMIMVRLFNKLERKHSLPYVKEKIRSFVPDMEGATFNFMPVGMTEQSTGAEQTEIAVRIFGKDLDVLKKLGREAMELIRDVKGLSDLEISVKEGKPEVKIYPDELKATQLGLSKAHIGTTLEAASIGKVATQYRKGGEEVDIRVRMREEDRNSIEKIRDLTVPTPMGTRVPLHQVAFEKKSEGPISINRERQARKVSVMANSDQRAVGDIVGEIKKRLRDFEASLPSGYSVDYGGSYRDMVEAFEDLLFALVVAILLVYMVMAGQFESLAQPLVVMFTVPLGLIGVVIGLSLFGMTLSVPAFMGFVILSGIVVNNAIVMIDYINQLRRQGLERVEAVVEGAGVRLRPILITSLTTILGILPMGLSQSEGSELRNPLGVTIAFGLFFAMGLTLFVIPVIYTIIDSIASRLLKTGKSIIGQTD